jgi:hypothetical protein
MRALGGLVAALTIVGASLPLADAAADQAAQLRPIDLRVEGGEDTWHADNDFQLGWERPPVADEGFPITAVDYRVRDAAGSVVIPETRLLWDATYIGNIRVPPKPGAYTADVWLEGPAGQRGPQVSATLLFDNARPGSARPLAPAGWVKGDSAAVLNLERPIGAQPISGIRGYAVSVDRGSESAPCAGPDRCTVAETDVRDGIDGRVVSLGLLPQGLNVVRAVAVSGSGMRSVETRSTIVRVDATLPAVALEGTPRGWAGGPVRLTATATDALSGMAATGDAGGPYTAISVDGAVPRVDAGDAAVATVTGDGLHSVAFYARDAAGNVDGESPPVVTVRIDQSGPAVAFARSQDPGEPERIEATVSDALSGPDPARGSIAVRPVGSRRRFEALPTTASAGRLVAHWDSDAFPVGTYEFRATGYDAAGNVASTGRRENGARMVLANPLKAPTKIEGGFGGRRLVWRRCARQGRQRRCHREAIESFEGRPTTRTMPYGHGTAFGGRLTSVSGSPLASLPVEVVETFAAGADPSQRTTTVQTAADGTFLTRLRPGPSRRVEALFAGNRVLTRASGGEVRLRVLGGIRLHASTATARVGGAPVIFSGRVGDLGAPIAAGGRSVELQFRLPGGGWSEFRTMQTSARGRFRYAYPFSDDDSRGVRFQFRAYAPARAGWPYEPAGSRPVVITGR